MGDVSGGIRDRKGEAVLADLILGGGVDEAAVFLQLDLAALRLLGELKGQVCVLRVGAGEPAVVRNVFVRLQFRVVGLRRGVLGRADADRDLRRFAERRAADGAVAQSGLLPAGADRQKLQLAQHGHGQHVACTDDALTEADRRHVGLRHGRDEDAVQVRERVRAEICLAEAVGDGVKRLRPGRVRGREHAQKRQQKKQRSFHGVPS